LEKQFYRSSHNSPTSRSSVARQPYLPRTIAECSGEGKVKSLSVSDIFKLDAETGLQRNLYAYNVPMEAHTEMPAFRKPTAVERVFNRVFGFLVGLGIGFKHNCLLEVRGRKTGALYATPIDLLEIDGKKFLVAPRGRTQWVRNAEAAGEITLKKGSWRRTYRMQPVADQQKPALLKAYLDRFKAEVQRYFPVAAGSDAQAFVGIAGNYPIFELLDGGPTAKS
jgi:deazaflavin-dependent oxidoreductase (nitroreductase family)